jgi:hypothetical protein
LECLDDGLKGSLQTWVLWVLVNNITQRGQQFHRLQKVSVFLRHVRSQLNQHLGLMPNAQHLIQKLKEGALAGAASNTLDSFLVPVAAPQGDAVW